MNRFIQKPTKLLFTILLFSVAAMSQMPTRAVPAAPPPQEDFTWWYISIFVLFIALAGAVGFWYKKKYGLSEGSSAESGNGEKNVDAELAWLKSASNKKKGKSKNYPTGLPRTSRVLKKDDLSSIKDGTGRNFDETKKKLQQIQFDKLPVNRFDGLNEPKYFDALPISNDDALMSAIEQTHCEDEEDPEIREVSIRILARFRTRNSIEALEQVAKYDISSSLRSKAVAILAEFDHQSVFETILLCGADPTREVRAAAARALFQLSFD
ncbi:MAG: HEAT repeat domain-containing protein, partial [Pyrinomonadaceae bacterium]|nr:HEAT repeat domain-containing protein [Pyrinomonadaceae bacterium]